MRQTKHRPKVPLSPMPSQNVQTVAGILTEHGYGMSKDVLAQELGKIENLQRFLYTLYRCAEKDKDAFSRALNVTEPGVWS